MAGWISSKLKVAESLLQQIDQQAAESLGKGERVQSDGLDVITSPKTSGTISLRDQLKKKASNDDENLGKLSRDSANFSKDKSSSDYISRDNKHKRGKDVTVKPNSNLKSNINDSDWTQLLNTTKQPSSIKSNRFNAVQKDGGRVGNVGLKLKGNGKVLGNSVRKADYGNAEKATGVVGNGGGEPSRVSDTKIVGELELESSLGLESVEGNTVMERGDDKMGNGDESLDSEDSIFKVDSLFPGTVESHEGTKADSDDQKVGVDTFTVGNRNGVIAKDVLGGSKIAFQSCSDHESDSESSSTSDSGAEHEREERMQKRRQMLAAKAATKAAEAIKEQENAVARLEGEKQSLEKILEEQANQAAQEASELQSMMMKMMDAAELEKQKHNHTRMEVLARLARLEIANADLAKSLAAAQWNLEVEVNRLAEFRHQAELKGVVLEELKRKIYTAHQTRETLTSPITSKGYELQTEILEDECAFATDKISRLQEKGMKLEANIDTTLRETESLTEVEIELRRRLHQMTDHLIQKQSQVESLSSDKATLLFRIEAVSRLLEENKGTNGDDIPGFLRGAATWESTASKLQPVLENTIQSGRQHLGSLLRQLDAIFSAGAVYLARNPSAKLWSLLYLSCLHLWVFYILFSHPRSTEDSTSSSVLSLENINGSIGV